MVVFGKEVLRNSVFTFLLSKARQAKTEHIEMKILQPIFGILVALMKNEFTKICNEPGINRQGQKLRKKIIGFLEELMPRKMFLRFLDL